MQSKRRFAAPAAAALLAFSASSAALAQGGTPFSFAGSEGGGGGGGDYHGFNVSMPIVNLNKEAIVHVEMNLGGHATLSLEGVMKGAYEEIDEEEMLETGESRSSSAKGGTLMFSRYSQPMSMAGFYWGLGVGYREETVDWRVRPDQKDNAIDYTLLDQEMRLTHHARMTGTTGHLRVGYRYVGEEWPFVGGGYVGARHFQAGVRDGEPEEMDEGTRLAAMTDREKDRLRRMYATRPECGLEIGIRF